MTTIKVKGIALENYKGFQKQEISLGDKTEISGRNGLGKSTIMDAYLDVITGKMADGTTPDSIRPIVDGIEVNRVDIVRSLNLEVNGKATTLSKITKQKWRKPRGQSEEVFDGNVTTYEVDGFDTKPQAFAEHMSEIAPADILYLCSNAEAFLSLLNKSTAEARKTLEKLSGFNLEEFIASHAEYAEVGEISKGHSIEETLKQLRKTLNAQKKKVDAKNTEIKYEKNREIETIETADLELAKGEWNGKLKELDEQEEFLDKSTSVYDDLSSDIMNLKKREADIILEANTDLGLQKGELNRQINDARDERVKRENHLREETAQQIALVSKIEMLKGQLAKAQIDWTEKSKETFDRSELERIRAEVFDEDSLICPTCGQPFPEEKQNELRKAFEKSRKTREEREISAEKRFLEERDKTLALITKTGNTANTELKAARTEKERLEAEIAVLNEEISTFNAKIKELQSAFAELPESVDLSGNKELQKVRTEISEKETALASLSNITEQRQGIRAKRKQYTDEVSKIEREIGRTSAAQDEKERRLESLESELRDLNQTRADIERQIDIVSQFSRDKNEALAQMVNPHFREFQFNFLTYTQEGNPYEVCELVRGGIEFPSLNYSDQLLCRIDLLRGFQELSDLCLPIWCDNVESINAGRLPEVPQQLVVLKVTDDERLVVKNGD